MSAISRKCPIPETDLQQPERRALLTRAGAGAGLLAAGNLLHSTAADAQARAAGAAGAGAPIASESARSLGGRFWPDGIKLPVSISMQFEAGGQPPKGTDSPFPKVDFPAGVPADLAANTWFAYGYREGIPRMLDLWDRHGIKVTAHIIGEAAKQHPKLAREIVERGHEASGH
jgi:Polysaccharide deacetylase